MKRFSYKSIYYRDSDKVMRKIPDFKIMIDNKKKILVKVYTFSPAGKFVIDDDNQKAIVLEVKL